MKLRELEIEHFGLFSGQSLEFDAGFSLVFGPNEAGKSTLLQLIRELLFGFKPLRNPYAFDDHAGDMAASAAFDVSDGTRLRFRRRKGTKNEVVGSIEPSGREIDAAALSGFLGGASKELYEQVFGFSLRELTEADESLKRANLTEALYGGGLGGLANFQKVQCELQAEAEALFTPRGRSKQLIHKLLGEIKEQTKELKNQTVKPRDFEQLERESKEAATVVETQRRQLDELRGRKAHLERIANAIEPWLRQRHANGELARLSVPAAFPVDGGEQFKRLKARRGEVADELIEIEQSLADESEQLSELQPAPEMVANEAAIRELEQQIKQIAGFRDDLPRRCQEAEAIKSDVLAQLRSFSPDWDHRQLERLKTTLAQRDRIDRLKSESDSLERRRVSATAERSRVLSSITTNETQLEQLTIQEIPDNLPSLIEQADSYERELSRLQELREKLDDAAAKLQGLIAKLNAPLGAALDESADLPMPLAATIAEFRERLRQTEQSVEEAQRQAAATRREQVEKEEQLAELDARAAVPDRTQLLTARQDRDAGWQLLRTRAIDPRDADEQAMSEWLAARGVDAGGELIVALADTYAETVGAADALADERQDKAQQAADCDRLKFELARLAKRLIDEEQLIESCRQGHAAVAVEWESLWTNCPFRPLSPDAMLQWTSVYDNFVAARSDRAQLVNRATTLETSIAKFETQLAATITGAERTARERLAIAKQLHEAAGTARGSRQAYERQRLQQQEELRSLDEQLASIEAQQLEWQVCWEKLLDEFQFPRDWDVHVASKILSGLTTARGQWDQASGLDVRVKDMTSGIADFEAAVRSHCERLAPDLAEFVPEHAMRQLQSRLEAAKAAQRDQKNLEASCAKLAKRQAAKKDQLAKIDTELLDLLATADSASEAEFEQVAAAAKRQADLLLVCREAASEINAIRQTEDEEKFALALQNADADSLVVEQHRLGLELKTAESEFDEAFKKSTLLDEQRKNLDGTSRAADLALDLESTRSQLAGAVDRWAPLVLAQALMKHAIKKFEREHQPAMLAEVERLLGRMTLGRYTAIERKLDEHGTLLIVDETGKRKEPHQLSTGTREQLYLAIRLAYIHHYCQDTEPLPIVMDDVLVNFDAERARQTLRVFAEVADRVQIIFLTCHQHVMELVRDVIPASKPIILPGGNLPNGLVVAARSKKPVTFATQG